MLRFSIIPLLTLVTFITTATTTASAQPLADRVRADAIVYFGWSGTSAIGPGYEGSHLKAVIDASNFDAVFDEFLPRVMDRIGKEAGGEFEPVRKALTEVAGPMWKHPTAFYFGGVDFKGKDAPPMPRVALLCRAGADGPAMLKRLTDLTKQVPKDMPLRVAQTGDVVVVSFGFDHAAEAVASPKGANPGGGKSLAQDDAYRAALANVHKEPLAALYVDVARLLTQVDKAVDTYAPDEAKQQWPRVRDISGLAGLRRMIVTEAFEGKEWGSRGFIDAPAPRKGLLKVLESAPLSDAALQAIPASATIAGVVRFDFARLVSTVRGAVKEFNPEVGAQVDAFLEQGRDAIGLDVEKDVLAPLGDEWAYYSDPTSTGKGMLGFAVVNRLRDPAKAQGSLAKLAELLNALVEEQLRQEKVTVAFKQTKVGDMTIHYLAIPLITPAWAVADGNLYIGLFPRTVAVAAEHVRSKGPSLLQNEPFAAARKQLGGGAKATSVQFIDLPRTAPDAYASWLMISRVVGVADLFGVDSPPMVGPPLKTLLAHLSPAVTVMWEDDKGWYVHSRVPFPGSNLLVSDPFGGAFNSLAPFLQAIGGAHSGMGLFPAGTHDDASTDK
jgi:hypothetical protein